MKTIKTLAALCGVLAITIGQSTAQNTLQFTSVNTTPENAIQLHWASTNGELYQIQYANALATNDDGSTAWQVLYDNYPSHGTNTFVGDFGNYDVAPQITHPKNNVMRFYRILDQGQDSLPDVPTVTIGSLTNNSAVSDEIAFTVTAATDQPGLHGTILYVDGQQMRPPDDVTNFTVGSTNYEIDTYSLNTCEWFNGTHVLFATTEAASQYSSQMNGGAILTGHAVSPFVSLVFSNLIEEISFSQPLFDPSSGQTQQVSAVFAANCDWTLNIEDVYSNIVQTASGSGTSMLYNWDGTANGTNLPSGLYFYYISAETNGQAYSAMSMASSSAEISTISEDEPMQLWALAPDSSGPPLPLAIYPPGLDTNGFTIFEASQSEVRALTTAVSSVDRPASAARSATFSVGGGGGFAAAAAGGGGSSSGSQNSPPAPQRPPTNPIRGLAGSFGIAVDTYNTNGTNGPSVGPLNNGLNPSLHLYISMDDDGSTGSRSNPPRPEHVAEANQFAKEMQYYGWNNSFNKVDDQFSINDLRGSGTMFNNVNMGVIMLHGTYGNGSSATDYAANGCKQMYFSVTSGGSAQYLRFSEMNLGGSGTNGLKWMVIDACHSLQHNNWSSMKNKGIKPYNSNLHLILGGDTVTWTSTRKWYNFARYLNYGRHNFYSPYTIRDGYYQANTDAFQNSSLPSGTVITLAVAGDSACLFDSFQTNTPPSGSWQYDSLEVFSN